MDLRGAFKSAVRALGYDIRKVETGQDAFRDVAQILRSQTSSLVFDVGANTGQTIERLLSLLPTPVIHAFEPGQAAFRTLQRSYSVFKTIRLNQFALGAAPGQLPFFENSELDMSSLLPLGPAGWGSIERHAKVDVVTIDDYCTVHGIGTIDLLKSDTQGFDLEVLKGADRMLAEHRIRLIYLEIIFSKMYENLPRADKIYAFMSDHGFELVSFYKTYFQNGRAGWTDALFIDPDFKG
jgi:FkbM family methyltransferase